MTQKNKISLWIVGVIIAIGFYLFSSVVPYYSDDLWYTFIHESDRSYPTQSVTSISDIITSQINHYMTVNGRLPVTFIVQMVVTFVPKWIFDILNAIIFTLTSLMVVLYVSPASLSAKRMAITAMALFLMLPGHYETMMWATGAINYLWVAACILSILLVWRRIRHQALSRMWHPLLFLYGMIGGWSNEALAIGLAAGIIVEIYFQRKHYMAKSQWILAAGILVGVSMILLAPGSWNRMGGMTHNDNLYLYLPIIGALILPVTLAISLCYLYKTDPRQVSNFVAQHRISLTAAVTLIPICLITYQYATRSFFGVALFSLIPLMAMIDQCAVYRKLINHNIVKILLFAAIVYIPILYVAHYKNELAHHSLIDKYVKSNDGIIAHHVPRRAWYAQPYTLDIHNEYSMGWSAHHMAAYYQHKPLQWLTPQLYHALTHSNDLFTPANRVAGNNDLYTTDSIDVYILPPSSPKPSTLTYYYSPVSVKDNVPLQSKLRRLITPSTYPLTETLPAYYEYYDMDTHGYFRCIKKSAYRDVVRIDINK